RRNLLLCFDAFGTLFSPRPGVPEQYVNVARECGFRGPLTVPAVTESFKKAFADQQRLYPNYGRASGMGAEKWWTNVIKFTFLPFNKKDELPPELAPRLLRRFGSGEGYRIADPNIPELITQLKDRPRHLEGHTNRHRFDRVVVGVITNSDDRVPGILSSLGFAVSPLRFGSPPVDVPASPEQYQIDFHCMSYDVGVSKPSEGIFKAAELMAGEVLSASTEVESPLHDEQASWTKIYVGDEFSNDVVGSMRAGWNSV
ncbi:hypothetical protein B0T16DRAFT_311687, partial [Cercophora newfieldiana]